MSTDEKYFTLVYDRLDPDHAKNEKFIKLTRKFLTEYFSDFDVSPKEEEDSAKYLILSDPSFVLGITPLFAIKDEYISSFATNEMAEYIKFLGNLRLIESMDQISFGFDTSVFGFDKAFAAGFKESGLTFLKRFLDQWPHYAFLWKFSDRPKKLLIENYTKFLILNDAAFYKRLKEIGLGSTLKSKTHPPDETDFIEFANQCRSQDLTNLFLKVNPTLYLDTFKSINRKIDDYEKIANNEILETINSFLLDYFSFSFDDTVVYDPARKTLRIPGDKTVYAGVSQDVAKVMRTLYVDRNNPSANKKSLREMLYPDQKMKDIFASENAKILKAKYLQSTPDQKWFFQSPQNTPQTTAATLAKPAEKP